MTSVPAGGVPPQVPQPVPNPAAAAVAQPKTAYSLQSQELHYHADTGQMELQIQAKDQNGKAITIKKTLNVSVEGGVVAGKVALAMIARFKEVQIDKQLALEFLQNEADNINRKITHPPSAKTKLAVDFDERGFTVARMKEGEVVSSRHVQVGAMLGVNQQELQELQNKHKDGIELATTHVQCRVQLDALFKNMRASDVEAALGRIFGDKNPITIADLSPADRHGLDEHEMLSTLLRAPVNAGLLAALVQKWKQVREEVQDEIEQGSLYTLVKDWSKETFEITKPSISRNPLLQIITKFAKTPPVQPPGSLELEEQLMPPAMMRLVTDLEERVDDTLELAASVDALQPQERLALATHLPIMVAKNANTPDKANALATILKQVKVSMAGKGESVPVPSAPPAPPAPPTPPAAASILPPQQATVAELEHTWGTVVDALQDKDNTQRQEVIKQFNPAGRLALCELVNIRANAVIGVNSQTAENLRSLQAMLKEYIRLHP